MCESVCVIKSIPHILPTTLFAPVVVVIVVLLWNNTHPPLYFFFPFRWLFCTTSSVCAVFIETLDEDRLLHRLYNFLSFSFPPGVPLSPTGCNPRHTPTSFFITRLEHRQGIVQTCRPRFHSIMCYSRSTLVKTRLCNSIITRDGTVRSMTHQIVPRNMVDCTKSNFTLVLSA